MVCPFGPGAASTYCLSPSVGQGTSQFQASPFITKLLSPFIKLFDNFPQKRVLFKGFNCHNATCLLFRSAPKV